MFFQPFHELFPDIAERETRTFTTFNNHPDLPADEYALIESYCNEPDCDCRRVFSNIGSRRRQKIEAVITYGWENKRFYANWLGFDDTNVLKRLKGPALNIGSPQSELAPALLREVTHMLHDKNYVNRLKRHYRMFKDAMDAEAAEAETVQVTIQPEVGRNYPCPCGSGKKYKKCRGR